MAQSVSVSLPSDLQCFPYSACSFSARRIYCSQHLTDFTEDASMRLGSTPYLRFSMRVLAIAALAAAFQSSLLAQDNPMDLPPRTAPPPPSVQKEVPEQPPANGQQPTSPSISESPNAEDNSRFVFKKQVQEVFLHATVIDESGRMVTNLTRNAF